MKIKFTNWWVHRNIANNKITKFYRLFSFFDLMFDVNKYIFVINMDILFTHFSLYINWDCYTNKTWISIVIFNFSINIYVKKWRIKNVEIWKIIKRKITKNMHKFRKIIRI